MHYHCTTTAKIYRVLGATTPPHTHTHRNIHALDRGMGMGRSSAGAAGITCLAVCACCVGVCARSCQQLHRPEGQPGQLCLAPFMTVCL